METRNMFFYLIHNIAQGKYTRWVVKNRVSIKQLDYELEISFAR